MTIIVGRLTSDALVKTIEEGKTVVNFTIAVNDYFKPKGSDEPVEYTEFFQCAYWYNSAVATSLKKGAVVEAGGRLFATGYMAGQEIRPQINLQVQHVKVHAFAKNNNSTPADDNASDVEPSDGIETQQQSTKQNGTHKSKRVKTRPDQRATARQQEIAGEEPSSDLPF